MTTPATAADIAADIAAALTPEERAAQAAEVEYAARLLAELRAGRADHAQVEAKLAGAVFARLQAALPTNRALISFTGAQTGDVKFNDVAGRDIYKNTFISQVAPSRPAALIILLLVLVVASLIGVVVWRATESLGWTIAGMLAGLFGVLTLGFITRVGEHLDKVWTKPTADWIDRRAQLGIGGFGFERRYRTYLIQEHRFFDVKGLTTQGPHSLLLQEVFVDLGLAPQEAQKASADPLRMPEQLRTGRHSVWAYLTEPRLEQHGLVILGPPGSGKTTLLRHIALSLSQGDSGEGRRLKGLPVLLALRNQASVITTNEQFSLPGAIHAHLTREEGPKPPDGWFAQQLRAGRCYVLLDGLDEVSDPQVRQKVVAWVQHQMQAYPRNRFPISSRPFGYRENPLSGVTVLEVHPFTSAQVRRFVEQWYLANMLMSTRQDDAGVRRDARYGARDLLQRINDSPSLSDLAINPLLLTMIANVHRHRSSLPGRRVELYAEICDVFLGKRQQAKGIALDLTPAQKQSILQPLAYYLMAGGLREIAVDQAAEVIGGSLQCVDPSAAPANFLSAMCDSSGLIQERENGIYGFNHLTFQEYLAAAYIKEQKREAELVAQVGTSWWHETILLYAAQGDGTELVRACMVEEHPVTAAIVLAIELRDEARQIDPTVRLQLEELLTQGVEDADPERRRMIVEALLARRLRRMRRLDERRAIDTSLVSHAEYQLFLDQQAYSGSYHQPDHWIAAHYPSGTGHDPALGMRWSDALAFCEWLSKRSSDEWLYRLPSSDEARDWATSRPNATLVYWASPKPGASWPKPAVGDHEAFQVQYEYDMILGRVMALLTLLAESNLNYRALALALDRNLARDLDHIRNLARDLARNLARARDLVRNLDINFDLAQDIDRASYFAFNIFRDIDIAQDIRIARDIARDIAIHIKSSYYFVYKMTRIFTITYDIDPTILIGKIFPVDQAASTKLGPLQAALNLERGAAIASQCDLQGDLQRTKLPHAEEQFKPSGFLFAEAVAQLMEREGLLELRDKRAELCRFVRLYSLGLVLRSDARLEKQSPLARVTTNAESRELQELRAKYWELYATLATFDLRIAGKLPPVEGILLVRERREQGP